MATASISVPSANRSPPTGDAATLLWERLWGIRLAILAILIIAMLLGLSLGLWLGLGLSCLGLATITLVWFHHQRPRRRCLRSSRHGLGSPGWWRYTRQWPLVACFVIGAGCAWAGCRLGVPGREIPAPGGTNCTTMVLESPKVDYHSHSEGVCINVEATIAAAISRYSRGNGSQEEAVNSTISEIVLPQLKQKEAVVEHNKVKVLQAIEGHLAVSLDTTWKHFGLSKSANLAEVDVSAALEDVIRHTQGLALLRGNVSDLEFHRFQAQLKTVFFTAAYSAMVFFNTQRLAPIMKGIATLVKAIAKGWEGEAVTFVRVLAAGAGSTMVWNSFQWFAGNMFSLIMESPLSPAFYWTESARLTKEIENNQNDLSKFGVSPAVGMLQVAEDLYGGLSDRGCLGKSSPIKSKSAAGAQEDFDIVRCGHWLYKSLAESAQSDASLLALSPETDSSSSRPEANPKQVALWRHMTTSTAALRDERVLWGLKNVEYLTHTGLNETKRHKMWSRIEEAQVEKIETDAREWMQRKKLHQLHLGVVEACLTAVKTACDVGPGDGFVASNASKCGGDWLRQKTAFVTQLREANLNAHVFRLAAVGRLVAALGLDASLQGLSTFLMNKERQQRDILNGLATKPKSVAYSIRVAGKPVSDDAKPLPHSKDVVQSIFAGLSWFGSTGSPAFGMVIEHLP